MGRDDWFRSESWDAAAQELFAAKLARSRTPFHRAQYLRIQGLTLVETRDRRRVEAGRELLERVLAEYPDEVMEVAGAHFALGESFVHGRDHERAVAHLRTCLDLETGRHFRHGTELLLAETLIAVDDGSQLDEASQLLDASERHAVFGSEFWRIEVARARLLARAADRTRAADHARSALELLEPDKPAFPRHPTVGLIEADKATIKEMRRLSKA
jgi:hypothetical protein